MRISTLTFLLTPCDSIGPLSSGIQADRYLLQAERAVLECGTKRAPAPRWNGWQSLSKGSGWSRRGKTNTAMRKSGRWGQYRKSCCRGIDERAECVSNQRTQERRENLQ